MQSKTRSFNEANIGTLIGFIISLLLQILVFPFYGMHPTLDQNISITAIFTVASVIRGYFVRRMFNLWRPAT